MGETFLSWQFLGWTIAFLVSLGGTMLGVKEYKAAKACFVVSAGPLLLKAINLSSNIPDIPLRIALTVGVFGIIVVLLFQTFRWIEKKERLTGTNRDLFLLDCNLELIWLAVTVKLTSTYAAKALGHFRVLVRFKPAPWVRQPRPSFWFGIRDGYLGSGDGMVRQVGIRQFAGLSDITGEPLVDQQQMFSDDHISVLQIGGLLSRQIPLEKLGDLDQLQIEFFCNEGLIPKMESVAIQANTYSLLEVKADQMAEHMKPISFFWPLPLSAEELASRWVRLSIKPKPGDRMTIERRWIMDFNLIAPKRIRDATGAPIF